MGKYAKLWLNLLKNKAEHIEFSEMILYFKLFNHLVLVNCKILFNFLRVFVNKSCVLPVFSIYTSALFFFYYKGICEWILFLASYTVIFLN